MADVIETAATTLKLPQSTIHIGQVCETFRGQSRADQDGIDTSDTGGYRSRLGQN
jgi:hypothetical protein